MSFVLKNQMHMEAHDLANFRLIASIPLYLSFIFGLCRDSSRCRLAGRFNCERRLTLPPNVAACHAMANLLAEKQNICWHEYSAVVAAGAQTGIGLEALPPVRKAMGCGFDSKTITLSYHWHYRTAVVLHLDAAQFEEP